MPDLKSLVNSQTSDKVVLVSRQSGSVAEPQLHGFRQSDPGSDATTANAFIKGKT